MRAALFSLALSAVSTCAGAIGAMTTWDAAPPSYFCAGAYADAWWWNHNTILYAGAKFTPLYNYAAIFHAYMCQLQHYTEDGSFGYTDCTARTFDGCATPEDRTEAARTKIPLLHVRNKAVTQLCRFFEAGGVTNHGIITVGPLMHAYGGSPLCVWPAQTVVDVSGGGVPLQPVQGAKPLRAGVGRGGCFSTAAWLSCTDWADRPQGFNTGRNPFGDLGEFFHDTLAPHFAIDWASNGVSTSAAQWCANSYFLTNSPNYLSAEAVPTNVTASTLRLEPWRRSWEALGGLDLFAWHTNTNVFEYAATNVWRLGTISAASSNAMVSAIQRFIEDGHPELSNREYFPANGTGVTKNQYYGPQGYNGDSVRPKHDYDPSYVVFQRGNYKTTPPYFPAEITYTWQTTNVNARTISAPVSNYVHGVTNTLRATSVKRWYLRKTNEQGGGRFPLTNDTVVADFGWGQHEYSFETYVLGPTSYDWEMTSEEKPETRVDVSSVSNYMRTVCRAHMITNMIWKGIPPYSAYDDPSRASSVCRYEDGGMGTAYFMSGDGAAFGGNYSPMFDFMAALVAYDPYSPYKPNPDELSEKAHPLPRAPVVKNPATPPSWDTIWSGPGIDYTIRTTGVPQPYRSPGGQTNTTYTATYDDPDEPGKWWEDIIQLNAAGDIVFKLHQPMPYGLPEIETGDGAAYIPTEEAEAKSEIFYTIENWTESFYKVEWEPVRAWGIYNGVTNHADWPQD